MNVGIVTDFYYPWVGGPSAVVHNLSRGLSLRGHTLGVLAPSPDGPGRQEHDGRVKITRAPTSAVPFGYNLRSAVLPVTTVRRWLDEFRPDVVNVHHPFALSSTALLLARRRGIPVVATNHTIPQCSLWGLRNASPVYTVASRAMEVWLQFLLGRASRVTTPTETAAAALHDFGFSGQIDVVSNGVECSVFRPGPPDLELRQRLRLDGRPVVLYTGRLDAEKQMDIWLRAAAAAGCDCQLVVGGRGTDRARAETLARELGIAERTRFIGYVDREDLPGLYRLADVYCMMSPVELQSISTLEAMASGLPVVAADAGALPELVRPGENGFLVPPGDWKAAGAALSVLLRDGASRTAKGLHSRDIALGHDLDRSIDRYERLLICSATETGGERIGERAAAGR